MSTCAPEPTTGPFRGVGTGPTAGTGPIAGPSISSAPLDTASWLTTRRNQGATPSDVVNELVGNGWDADVAARWALRSLRSSDRQPVLWFSLCWAAGLGAVGFPTAMHQLLAPYPNRDLAALALTVAVVMVPIAAFCGVLARRSEQRSTFTVWSPERRFWFGTLAVCTAVVGLLRLITYVYVVISSIVAARPEPLYGQDLAQVAISLVVAIPLFYWSFTEWRRSNLVISGLAEDAVDASGPRR